MAHALKDLFCVVSIVAVFAGAYVFWNIKDMETIMTTM